MRVPIARMPFQERWRRLVMSGAKTTTVRTKRCGSVGDEFEVDGARFRLVEVSHMTLHMTRDFAWRDEGMSSPEEFERAWIENHPTRGFRADDSVWLHRFERVH